MISVIVEVVKTVVVTTAVAVFCGKVTVVGTPATVIVLVVATEMRTSHSTRRGIPLFKFEVLPSGFKTKPPVFPGAV